MRGLSLTAAIAAILLAAPPQSALAVPSFFDIITGTEVITGPPYPTACHRAQVAHQSAGVFEHDGSLALGIRRAADGMGAPIGVDLVPLGGEPSSRGFADNTSFEARFRSDRSSTAAADANLRLLFELTGVDGQPGRLLTLHSDIPFPDPGRFFSLTCNDSWMEITCLVQFACGVEHELEIVVELPMGLMLSDNSVDVTRRATGHDGRTDPQEEHEFFTAHPEALFVVGLRVSGDQPFANQSPLFTLTLTGRFLGGPSPVEARTWGAIKALYDG
jgi:hypothetical protein